MTDTSLRAMLRADLLKIRPSHTLKDWLSALLFNQSFKRILLYRLNRHYYRKSFLYRGGVKCLDKWISTHYSVYISPTAHIGKGLCLSHCFSIIISQCQIGDNVTIMQQVTIGSSRGGNRQGYPTIGNNVFIGCGAKIIGRVNIGNNVVIGANAVVTKDIPDNAIAAGVPARVLNYNGPEEVKLWTRNLSEA